MIVYGKNVLLEIDSKKVKKAFIARKEYIEILNSKKIKYEFVDIKKLNNMTDGVHQGVVLDVFDYEYKTMNDIKSDFVVVLDHLSDPHNFGAIIRTCACAGVKDIIIPNKRSVLVNDTVIKVSAGNIDRVNIIMVSNLNSAIRKLQDTGYFVYASEMNGNDYKTLDFTGKKVLVIGNEGEGVSRLVKENSDFLVSIPMCGNTESLNASVAAGILIFEMR